MFKISITDTPAQRKLVVEGKLVEPWVDELRTAWRNMSRALDRRKLVIDLSSVSVISARGLQLSCSRRAKLELNLTDVCSEFDAFFLNTLAPLRTS